MIGTTPLLVASRQGKLEGLGEELPPLETWRSEDAQEILKEGDDEGFGRGLPLGLPTKHRKTERQKTRHRMTERRMTEHRITDRRMTEH